MPTRTALGAAPWRALALAGLISGLLLMHGLGLGHSTIAAAAPSPVPVHTAYAAGADGDAAAAAPVPTDTEHQAVHQGTDRGNPDHGSLLETCLAVLGGLVVLVALLLTRSTRHVGNWGARHLHSRSLAARICPQGVSPSIYQLCVQRI